mmetsp:Transcript_18275/g.30276  ORF Transcript_18275/g.30276 Transcript_18275/m.30276 type:complete len:575 (-) Transcript_18275:37-1761(-)
MKPRCLRPPRHAPPWASMIRRSALQSLTKNRPCVGGRAREFCSKEGVDTDKQNFRVIAIDRQGLLGEKNRVLTSSSPEKEGGESEAAPKTPMTPLLDEINTHVATRGPLSVAEYMQMCLGHPDFGYYQQREIFGRRGDFVTSPELTQMFGELLGIWMLTTWSQCGKPNPMHIVELGPGRGTLMFDLLRTTKAFPSFLEGASVHLVENSLQMREIQRQRLEVEIDLSEERSTSEEDDNKNEVMAGEKVSGVTKEGLRVTWHWGLDSLPQDAPLFCIAHEFFDALPVQQFQHTERGWCEVLVDTNVDDDNDDGDGEHNNHHLKFVLAPSPGPSSSAFLGRDAASRRKLFESIPSEYRTEEKEAAQQLEQQDRDGSMKSSMKRGHAQQPSSVSFPTVLTSSSSSSSDTLRTHDGVVLEPDDGIPIGARLEVGPYRDITMEMLAKKIGNQGGACLVVDYGEDFPQQGTLQGVKEHKFAHVLETPGEVDLSAHVNFSSLRSAAQRASPDNLQVFPIVPQGAFLINMNIEARMSALCEHATEEEKENIERTVMRLVSEDEMGLLFKVMAITQTGIGAPAG